jgi:hypothetical protein
MAADFNRFCYEPARIDYRKLAAGLDHYQSLGYEYTEAPWVVDREVSNATLPLGRFATSVSYGDLVGSGEQSFIELLRRGVGIQKACCVTPCFRDEDVFDELHHAYFMKLELINTKATEENLEQMINDAREFFEKYTAVDVEQTGSNAYDIVDKERWFELGSYGFRVFHNTTFIYGTGIALPRLDTVVQPMVR